MAGVDTLISTLLPQKLAPRFHRSPHTTDKVLLLHIRDVAKRMVGQGVGSTTEGEEVLVQTRGEVAGAPEVVRGEGVSMQQPWHRRGWGLISLAQFSVVFG